MRIQIEEKEYDQVVQVLGWDSTELDSIFCSAEFSQCIWVGGLEKGGLKSPFYLFTPGLWADPRHAGYSCVLHSPLACLLLPPALRLYRATYINSMLPKDSHVNPCLLLEDSFLAVLQC